MRLAILSLSLVVSVSIARADESCFDKPLRKAWNGMARYLGICYSHGYHVCKSCGAQCVSPACSCGAQAFVEPGVITDEMNYVPVPMSQPAMVAPGAPAYMMHGHSIPDHYNEEIAKPERQYSPKPQVPTQVLQAPKPPIAREAPAVVRPAEPASPSDRANHAARDAMQLERAPAPEEVKPALPGPIASPSPTKDAPTASTPESLPTPSPLNVPGNTNDDDLLVPPDTSLLDSISYPRTRSPYRTSPTPRTARIVTEPRH